MAPSSQNIIVLNNTQWQLLINIFRSEGCVMLSALRLLALAGEMSNTTIIMMTVVMIMTSMKATMIMIMTRRPVRGSERDGWQENLRCDFDEGGVDLEKRRHFDQDLKWVQGIKAPIVKIRNRRRSYESTNLKFLKDSWSCESKFSGTFTEAQPDRPCCQSWGGGCDAHLRGETKLYFHKDKGICYITDICNILDICYIWDICDISDIWDISNISDVFNIQHNIFMIHNMQVRNQGNYTLMWKKTRVKQESNVRHKTCINLIIMIIKKYKVSASSRILTANMLRVTSDKRMRVMHEKGGEVLWRFH